MPLASYSALSHGITSHGLVLKMPSVRDTGEHSTQPPLVLPCHQHRGDAADLCQAAQGFSSQGAAKTLPWPLHWPEFSTCRGSTGCKDKDRASLPWPPPGHTSALQGGSKHSRLVVNTRQQFPGLLNTQKTIISGTSFNVFLSTGIQ